MLFTVAFVTKTAPAERYCETKLHVEDFCINPDVIIFHSVWQYHDSVKMIVNQPDKLHTSETTCVRNLYKTPH